MPDYMPADFKGIAWNLLNSCWHKCYIKPGLHIAQQARLVKLWNAPCSSTTSGTSLKQVHFMLTSGATGDSLQLSNMAAMLKLCCMLQRSVEFDYAQ